MTQYRGVPLGELSPHAYAIAEQVSLAWQAGQVTVANAVHKMRRASMVQGTPSVSVALPACCKHTSAHSSTGLPASSQPVMHLFSADHAAQLTRTASLHPASLSNRH